MADALREFIRRFTHTQVVEASDILRLGREYYYVTPAQRKLLGASVHRPAACGALIAAEHGQGLRPGTWLLDKLSTSDAKRVIVNDKSAWLVVCARPPLIGSVTEKKGNPRQGDTVLIMNKHGECLGYGVVKDDWTKKKGIIKLEYDIGDFLRRERKLRAPRSAHR